MPKKLIFIPFASDSHKRTGINMENITDSFHVYCKNFCVALVTLKKENPDCDVALVTNTDIPAQFSNILKEANIYIYHFPYDSFIFPDDYPWSLAFYKLSALRSVTLTLDYDYYCYLDTDVIANATLDPVWDECRENILLYDINHGLNIKDYRGLLDEISNFDETLHYPAHFGGEFFAASKHNANIFIQECVSIYNRMLEAKFVTHYGDEFILCIAAAHLKQSIKNAGAYIFRYWTGQFYLCSTRHIANPISILHLPNEKTCGIVKIFNRYISRGQYPTRKTIYRLCSINHPRYSDMIKIAVKKLLFHK